MNEGSAVILNRVLKLVLFFLIVFSLIFFVTWQNVKMYLLQRELDALSRKRSSLQKSLYLKGGELSVLQSRDRIRRIALGELGMVPVSYKDIRLIVYE
jgi:cell division protein FtsL